MLEQANERLRQEVFELTNKANLSQVYAAALAGTQTDGLEKQNKTQFILIESLRKEMADLERDAEALAESQERELSSLKK